MRAKLDSILPGVAMNADQLASMTVKLTFQSVNMGYLKASDAIPRLLDIVSKTANPEQRDALKDEFKRESRDTPAWIFLRWISQLIAVINTSESEMIQKKVVEIVKNYPQVIYYPFKVVQSNIEVNLVNTEVETTGLYESIKSHFEQKYENLITWTEALNCLVDPEHRTRYWLQLIFDAYKEEGDEAEQRINSLLEKMWGDVATASKPYIGGQIGQYNSKFVKWVD